MMPSTVRLSTQRCYFLAHPGSVHIRLCSCPLTLTAGGSAFRHRLLCDGGAHPPFCYSEGGQSPERKKRIGGSPDREDFRGRPGSGRHQYALSIALFAPFMFPISSLSFDAASTLAVATRLSVYDYYTRSRLACQVIVQPHRPIPHAATITHIILRGNEDVLYFQTLSSFKPYMAPATSIFTNVEVNTFLAIWTHLHIITPCLHKRPNWLWRG